MSAMVVLSASCMVLSGQAPFSGVKKGHVFGFLLSLHLIGYVRCWLSSMSWYASPRIFRFSNVISPSYVMSRIR
jgi:hypothetical protein